MTTATLQEAPSRDEAELLALIDAWEEALRAKDIDRLLTNYAPNVVTYDVKPPYQLQGVAALRSMWQTCMPCFPQEFAIEKRDFHLAVSGEVAFAHYLFRFTGPEKDHPAMQTWMRVSIGYQRIGGQWQIVHEHVSVPFDPMTGQAVFTLDP
jgi:uncharacterized protein (TIGR02246 family)